jgi:galactokinase/mevalonate kinase-like predicted kinase
MKVIVGEGLPETDILTSLLTTMMSEKGLTASFFEGKIETRLDFPREWGLGTSSTLIALLSKWTQIITCWKNHSAVPDMILPPPPQLVPSPTEE